MLESLDMTSFASRVGELFRVAIDDANTLTMRLIEVTPAGTPTRGRRRTPFSLVFRSPPDAPLPQRIYRLRHDELGALDLFLVPIGPDDDGMLYEAVFS
jgi:hypothetical protein